MIEFIKYSDKIAKVKTIEQLQALYVEILMDHKIQNKDKDLLIEQLRKQGERIKTRLF